MASPIALVRPNLLRAAGRGITTYSGLTSEQFMRQPTNEPVLGYNKGSAERNALEVELQQMYAKPMEVPICIGAQRKFDKGNAQKQLMPFEHTRHVAEYNYASAQDIREAIETCMTARQTWSRMSLSKRADIFLHAADLCAGKYRMRLNAATMLGQAKNIQQAEIGLFKNFGVLLIKFKRSKLIAKPTFFFFDAACELVDFLRFNAYFALQAEKYEPLSNKSFKNTMLLRSLDGFVAAIAPFNFTAIGGNLSAAPALMGNSVLWKPSDTAVLSNYIAYQALLEAGLPSGVVAFLPADGPTFGDTVCANRHLAGVNFTGSVPTFQRLWQGVAQNLHNYATFPRLVGECGGKNFHFVHPSAHMDTLLACTLRAAFEYQGQKCSACSRIYVPKSLWPAFELGLAHMAAKIQMGDVRDGSTFMSAVIDARALRRIKACIDYARGEGAAKDGARVLFGGECDDSKGYFVAPTLIQVTNPASKLLTEEIFGPVLTAYVYEDGEAESMVRSLKEATPFGLTGAVFSQDKEFLYGAREVLRDAVGNLYLNDKCTGSVVGQQPFGGARLSGTNDKAGGPHYVLRWASPQVVKESFVPLVEWRYPNMD